MSTKSTASSAVLILWLTAACRNGAEPTSTGPTQTPNVTAGHASFISSCATCHASRDGFDLALFGFADADIVRRARAHVDLPTAQNIVAYVRSLGISSIGPTTLPFQPDRFPSGTDQEFWASLFGSTDIARDLTPERLLAIDLRKTAVPLRLPRWSSEVDETDWMPETPLSPEVLNASSRAVRTAIDAYYEAPTLPRLVAALDAFEAVTKTGPNAVCGGHTGAHTRPRDCFEARRWMSSLAAVDLLRNGQSESPPVEVIDLWWETGEAAVSLYFAQGATPPRQMVFGWLYLAYTFGPHRFPEENGYLGQFLQAETPRLAAFTALRRMVDPRPARPDAEPVVVHPFWDAYLAITRAPREVKADVFRFSARFLDSWLTTAVLNAQGRETATRLVNQSYELVTGEQTLTSSVRAEVTASRDRLLQRLAALSSEGR